MFARHFRISIWGLLLATFLSIPVWDYWHFNRWTHITGLAVGCRRNDNQFQLFAGAMTFKAVWYYDALHPMEGANTIQHWDYKWGDVLGFRIAPHFPNRRDWYFAIGFPL